MENQKDYELTEEYKDGFSLIDIAKKKPCWEEFIKLMEEFSDIGWLSLKFNWEQWSSKTIQNNLPWFVKNGFIQEKNELALCPLPNCGGKALITDNLTGKCVFCVKCGLFFDLGNTKKKQHDRINQWNNRK